MGQLSDETTYKPLQCDPTSKHVTSISKTIDRLVSKPLAKQISPKETSIARAYGLPKVHKDGCPLRMIVSLIDWPCHNLAKWLQRFLRSLTANSPHSIDNPVQFLDTIKNVTVSPNECMVSFDVVSLFTSIPLDLAREIRDLLTGTPLSITTDSLMDLLNHCLINYFQFNGKFYQHVKGMPMGSPISGLIAEAGSKRKCSRHSHQSSGKGT